MGQVSVVMPVRSPRPADAPRGVPATRLSDSLLRLIEPDVPLPPTADEIESLRKILMFAALVWNATVASTDPGICAAALDDLVDDVVKPPPWARNEVREQVMALAERKRAMFPTDMRSIVDLQVRHEHGQLNVFATSAGYV
jgi:hypothetical protein